MSAKKLTQFLGHGFLRAQHYIRLHARAWLILPALLFLPTAYAAISNDGYWVDASAARVTQLGQRTSAPTKPRTVLLNLDALQASLAGAPVARAAPTGVPVYLPMPNGDFELFEAFETQVMEQNFQHQMPELKTYIIQGLDDRTASGRINFTTSGFFGVVLRAGETVYVEPHSHGATDVYVSYTREEVYQELKPNPFQCDVKESDAISPLHRDVRDENLSAALAVNGTQLRTYRIAIAATSEFTADQGGAGNALNSIFNTVTALNALFERELAVNFVLVANNANIVYSGADPYTNGNLSAMLAENQTNLDNVATIGGASAYDIGHVFGFLSSGGSGRASLEAICFSGRKARGASIGSVTGGQAFLVDLVSHEIGHQLAATHTFNGSTSNCASARNAASAWEPASGSTRMSYGGICGAENLVSATDSYFHTGSLEQMLDWIGTDPTGSSCGTLSATGNTPPDATADADATIPISTPFTLGGSSSDTDGDSLTHTWEELDLGNASPPSTDDGSRPIFRSFPGVGETSRDLPKTADVLGNTTTLGESLPTTNRTMRFRMTARDNRAGGGGIAWDETQVTSSTSAGPFAITSLNSGGGVASGGTAAITWNVANTDQAPVNCAQVDILLSTDGGSTFATLLADDTANDGSESVTMPNIVSTQGRLKVQCSDNIFFDINNADFGIGASLATTCATPNLTLSEASTASDTLNISDSGSILDVNISVDATMMAIASTAGFAIQHLGTNVTLNTSNPSCFGENIDVVFDDEASVPVGSVCSGNPAINGSVQPVGSLNDYDSADQTGNWTLTYTNNFLNCQPNACAGTLNQWCVTTAVAVAAADGDGDGVADNLDNCTLVPNPDQRDTNGDLYGNACDPDLNNDGVVNVIDLGLLRLVFFTADPDADFNGDGVVNTIDLGLLRLFFFEPPGPSGLVP